MRVEVLGNIQVVSDETVVPDSPQLRRLIGLLAVADHSTATREGDATQTGADQARGD